MDSKERKNLEVMGKVIDEMKRDSLSYFSFIMYGDSQKHMVCLSYNFEQAENIGRYFAYSMLEKYYEKTEEYLICQGIREELNKKTKNDFLASVLECLAKEKEYVVYLIGATDDGFYFYTYSSTDTYDIHTEILNEITEECFEFEGE